MTMQRFRAVANTLLDEVSGFSPDHIEHQLTHVVRDPLGWICNRTAHLPQSGEMMQEWADHLDRLKDGEMVDPIPAALPVISKVAVFPITHPTASGILIASVGRAPAHELPI